MCRVVLGAYPSATAIVRRCHVPCVAGLGALKRKRPKLAALGVKPVRTREKNIRYIWRADVVADESWEAAGRGYVDIHLAGNGFLYR